MFNLKELAQQTAWVSSIDEEFVLDVSGTALWAVFGADDASGIPEQHLTCTDVLTPESDTRWTPWDEASETEREQGRCFRWIILTN
jgi:hypothetical protein